MAVRRLYEPLCIAFVRHYRFLTNSTDVSAVRPAAQVHTAPGYMESEDPNLVLREIEVWAELLKLLVIQIGYIVGVRRRCRYR